MPLAEDASLRKMNPRIPRDRRAASSFPAAKDPTEFVGPPAVEFRELVRRATCGDEAAAEKLVVRYGSHIRRLIERIIDPVLRAKFAPSDIVQAMWASFFVGGLQSEGVQTPEQLLALLTTIARHKLCDLADRYRSQMRDVRRERAFDLVAFPREDAPVDATSSSLFTRGGPSQAAIAGELWDSWTRDMNPQQRRILEMRLQGYSVIEIGQALGLNHRHLHRVLKHLLQRLEHAG